MESEVDPQARKLYALERLELRGIRRHKAPLRQIKKWAAGACKAYGVPPVSITIRRERGFGGSYLDDKIQLDPDCGRNGVMLAHELAHHFVAHLTPRAQDHGPAFVYYYAAILHGWRILPFEGMRAICRKHGVKMARK